MSYDHSLTADALLKPGTPLDAVIDAVNPLLEYFGYAGAAAFSGQHLQSDHRFSFDSTTGALEIYTCGDVSPGFLEVVEACAESLGPLTAVPGEFVLKDYDTAALENAVTTVPYGPHAEAINQFVFKSELAAALLALKPYLAPDDIEKLRAMANEAYAKNGTPLLPTATCN